VCSRSVAAETKWGRTALLIALAALGACGSHGEPRADAERNPSSAQQVQTDAVPDDRTPGSLAGTSWRLVRIMAMDDSVYAPEDRALYTLALDAGGAMRLRADCNRGRGTWTSNAPGQLAFGAIASTRALCPRGSLHDRYLAQFEWVRSYMLRGGHLFLATMADGAIIEFEPATE
jgi:heat shock protein HslJ